MKKLRMIMVLGTMMCLLGCEDPVSNNLPKESKGYPGEIRTVTLPNGHVKEIWSDGFLGENRGGIQESPECPKCRENLKNLLKEVIYENNK